MSLSLQSRRVGDIIVVNCSGRIIGGGETTALQQLVYNLIPDDPFLVLDFEQVDFIDSSGLGLLVRFLNKAQFAHGDLKLSAVPPRIREVLRVTRLQAVFDSHDSEAEAIAAFYQRPKSAGGTDRFHTDILCVEKSADVLAYVGEVLRQDGYGVLTADNLPDALMLLKAARPKAVVVSADLHAARGTWTADTFNDLADALPVVELPADFSCRDAGEAGRQLLERVRAVMPDPKLATAQRRMGAS